MQFPTFWSLFNFQHPTKSQIIQDKHPILCFCEQHHAHFTYNSESTFHYENFLTYCLLKIVIFAKSGKFLDFLVILASHNSPINLFRTSISLVLLAQLQAYNDFRNNQTLRVICSVMALIQNLKFLKGGLLCCVSHFFFCNRPCSLYILPHENKIALRPFYHKKIFLIENKYKTPFGCLALIFCQKYLLEFLSKIISETLHTPNKTFLQLQKTKRNTLCNFSLLRDKINLWVTMQNVTESHKKFS